MKSWAVIGALLALVSGGVGFANAKTQSLKTFEAHFEERSYAPGTGASLIVRSPTSKVTVQIFRCGPERGRTPGHGTMRGVAVEAARIVHVAPRAWSRVPTRLQYWPSGVYFARLRSGSQTFFAPFILRALPNLRSRVAVVMPTNTWQAYNFRDDDEDGIPNTWYADESVTTVDLSRPFEHRGVPSHFRANDVQFIRWLALTGKTPAFLADDDLGRVPSGRALLAAYDLVIFPGHHEYVTQHAFDVIESYHELGGNLMFLSANNFYRRVIRSGTTITRDEAFRDLGRPEASFVGVQYVDWNMYTYSNRPFHVVSRGAAPWFFKGTRLRRGSRFGVFGIEIDARTADSPPRTKVLANLPNIFGPGKTGEMVYHETPAGAKVFANGAMTMAGGALVPPMRQLVANLWAHLSEP